MIRRQFEKAALCMMRSTHTSTDSRARDELAVSSSMGVRSNPRKLWACEG